MTSLTARIVAAPVHDLFAGERKGIVLGSNPRAAYADFDGFVVAVTSSATPEMPNGVAVQEQTLPAIELGATATGGRERVLLGDVAVSVGAARRWVPAVAANTGATAFEVGRRGRGILRNCRISPAQTAASMARSFAESGPEVARGGGGMAGVSALAVSLAARSAEPAARAAALLLGRGGGLTPEGDDLLGGAAAAVNAFARAAGWDDQVLDAWLEALRVEDLRSRTSALSATLLECAAQGFAVEPLLHLLDLEEPADRWRPALHALLAIGHGTGLAWAAGSGLAASMIGTWKHEPA